MEPLANLIDQLLKLDAELKSPAGLELTAVEIADALWLARYLPPPAVAAPANEDSGTPKPPDSIDPIDSEPDSGKDSPPPDSSEIDSSVEEVEQKDDIVRESQQQQQSPISSESTEVKSAKEERVYAGYALSKRREIEQALRPLRRRAPSAIELELNEDETIERSAQFSLLNIRIFDPVLRAVQKRWLEVDLIVDNSNSMVVWQETAAEFGQLMRHQGFRDVRMWHLDTELDTEKAPTISPFRKKRGSTSLASCTKLPPAQGDRIVLVITDCVAPPWQNFQAFNLLAEWAKLSSVTLLQVWPEYFWFRTILRNIDTRASAYNPAVPNIRLITQREPDPFFDFLNKKDRQQATRSVFIPVVPLEDPHALSKWAQMVAGVGRFWLPAIEVPGDNVTQPEANDSQESGLTEVDPRELVDRFQATASLVTQKLGGLLASVPLELPIMRLVQETLPNSHRLCLSEFLTSGLVYRKREPENSLTDAPVFEFVAPEIRMLLRRTVRISDTIKVLERVGEFIAERMDQGKEFNALRLSEAGDVSVALNEQTLAFAKLKVEVLKSLGPFHRISAEQLQEEIAGGEPFIELKKQPQTFEFDIVTFEQLQEEIAGDEAFIQLKKQLQTFEFNIVEFVEQPESLLPPKSLSPFELKTFSFDTITVNAQGETIQRVQLQASFFEETLGNPRQNSFSKINPFRQNVRSLEMVLIPSGSFMMGSPKGEEGSEDSERPQHEVTISQFFMGKYPVTQVQWKAVAAMPQVNRKLQPDPSNFIGDNRPVEKVSWEEAIEFCDRLSAHTQRLYRLPSEAEWEYACRAETTTPFHFGETISTKYANYKGHNAYGIGGNAYGRGATGKYLKKTTPVGSFEVANRFGLFDMHGNVWEWCADHWHENYQGVPIDGSAWVEDGNSDRVLRGGSWVYDPENCRSASRRHSYLRYREAFNGFRVVCSAPRTQ